MNFIIRSIVRVSVSAAASTLCVAAHAQPVNKCVDAAGKVTYSQSPCPRAAKSTTLAPPPPAGAPAARPADGAKAGQSSGPKTAAELEQDFRKRRAEAEKAEQERQKKAAEAKDREENCRAARSQLASLESGARQSRVNEKGERVFLEDSQIEGEKERARRAVAAHCS